MLIDYPTFMVIGAQKAGTTWLYNMLCQHPEVAVPKPKESHFFNRRDEYTKGLQWYKSQFNVLPHHTAVGDFTPNYFWTSNIKEEIEENSLNNDIPGLIHKHCPDIKIVLSLRNPVERAISAYFHHLRNGRVTFKERITDVMHKFGILNIGYYHIHLKNWLKYFDDKKILILIYEQDLKNSSKKATIEKVLKHINVNQNFAPNDMLSSFNKRKSDYDLRIFHYPSLLEKVLRNATPPVVKNLPIWKIKIREEEKIILKEQYRESNKELEEMLKIKLPW